MAGERKGKTYEALVFVALQQLKEQGKLKGEVFWNQKPEGMTIEPDFTIGADKNHPAILLLITHSGASGNSHMKFWRNIGELVEEKTQLATVPRIFNIAFDSVIKHDLKMVQAMAFDGQLIVGDEKYGDDLQSWIEANSEHLPSDNLDKAEALLAVIKSEPFAKRLLSQLVDDLAILVKKTNTSSLKMWEMERKRAKKTAPQAKQTAVRRGLSKLLIFEDPEQGLSLFQGSKRYTEPLPAYVYDLGLARKSLAGAVGADEDIASAVKCLGKEQAHRILRDAPVDDLSAWLTTIRNKAHLEVIGQYVIDHYEILCNPTQLLLQLNDLHDNPSALINSHSAPANWPPGTVWLLEYLLELIKASTSTANGYGYAQMAREAAKLPNMPSADNRQYTIVLSDWAHRRGFEDMDTKFLRGIADTIANRLKKINKARLTALTKDLPDQIINNIIEAKLVTYRNFEPLVALIRSALPQIQFLRLRTCFAEAADLGGQAGQMRVLVAQHTFINWQSASDAGRDHKKKELCGRAVALRYSWDKVQQEFIPRPGVQKLILVVDGTWRQEDLNALARAGWDEIFYPDEMDKLAKAIV